MPRRKEHALRWSGRARRDLEQIAEFIARDSPQAARQWLGKLRQAAEGAARMPLAGRLVSEIGRDDVREVFVRSYRIVYGVREEHIIVLTVVGGGKRLAEQIELDDERR
jgi:addiction module RelE/StbE family toxin